MNGRLYDPIVGRFLSPDNNVQMADFTQNYNRYSYCLNNPLRYTDPSGEIVWMPILVLAAQQALVGGARANLRGENIAGGALKGVAVAVVGGPLSMIGGGSFLGNLALGVGQGTLSGGLDAALWGNDIGKGMLWGAAAGAVFTTLTSENFSNALTGEGFYTNENVFNNMIDRGMDKQAMLDYFGFEGEYIGGEGQSNFWFNKTDHSLYGIRYTDGAFNSYGALKNTNMKETFHLNRFAKNGLDGFELADVSEFKYGVMPEERLGVIHQYKNQGLYRKDSYNYLNAIGTTESFIDSYNMGLYNTPYSYTPYSTSWWHFVYKIPRRW